MRSRDAGEWTPRFQLSTGRADVNPLHLYEVDGHWQHPEPIDCRCGLMLEGSPFTVGHQACLATGGHRTYHCRTCKYTIYVPAVVDECDHRPFDRR